MSDLDTGVEARLDAWRRQGADRMDPLRFRHIEALARRTGGQHGGIRRLLDARLAELVGAYASDLAVRPPGGRQHEGRAAPIARPRSALATLLEHVERPAATHEEGTAGDPMVASVRPALGRLDDVRRMCAHARTESQLRQALEQAPENAGPLNSASLVHRALTLMRDASPEYLQPFMAYLDTLGWLEDMDMGGGRTAKGAPSTAGTGKRPRGKARSRRT